MIHILDTRFKYLPSSVRQDVTRIWRMYGWTPPSEQPQPKVVVIKTALEKKA